LSFSSHYQYCDRIRCDCPARYLWHPCAERHIANSRDSTIHALAALPLRHLARNIASRNGFFNAHDFTRSKRTRSHRPSAVPGVAPEPVHRAICTPCMDRFGCTPAPNRGWYVQALFQHSTKRARFNRSRSPARIIQAFSVRARHSGLCTRMICSRFAKMRA